MKKIILSVIAILIISTSMAQVSEQDGNSYKTIKIGEQQWMEENLNVSRFRNGDPVGESATKEEWIKALKEGKPAWAYYENDPVNGDKYGRLYNRYAVNDSRCLCPSGWKVPTDEDWKQLAIYLGMAEEDTDKIGWRESVGSKLKSTRTEPAPHPRWDAPNQDAANESDFSALPGGYRIGNGEFQQQGHEAVFWSSTAEEHLREKDHITAAIMEEESGVSANWARALWSNRSGFYRNYARDHGFSVRCIKK